MRTTPDVVTNLGPNEVFVFGSNREGRHGKGAAKCALQHFGAIYGRGEGIQGNSYAIVTKELRADWPPVSLPEIRDGLTRFMWFARRNPDLTFIVTPIGCGLGGFRPEQIAPMFKDSPSNVILPKCFIQ